MAKIVTGFLIVLFFFTCGFCANLPSNDLLKEECIQAYRSHSFNEPVIYGVKQKYVSLKVWLEI